VKALREGLRAGGIVENPLIDEALANRYGRNVGGKIYSQSGTLQKVVNPATATVEKAIALNTMAYRETAKRELAAFMLEHAADEIRPAEMKWNGRSREPVIVETSRVTTLVTLNAGKVEAYYVPKHVGEALQNGDLVGSKLAMWIGKYVNNPVKMFYTGANYGFWPVALVRDVWDYKRKMPKTRTWDVLFGNANYWRHFAKGWKAARASVTGKHNSLAEQAASRKMMLSVANPMGLSAEDTAHERILMKYHQTPASWDKVHTPIDRIAKAWNWWVGIGQTFERTSKIIGMQYLDANFPDMPEYQKQHLVQSQAGSPDFLDSGSENVALDLFMMFYNPFKQGWRAEVQAFKRSKTEWFLNNIKYAAVPTFIQMALEAGLLGDDDDETSKMFQSVSEYDKTNYWIVPLGWEDRETRKVRYIRIPKSEGQRLLSGSLRKGIQAAENEHVQARDLLNYAGGQVPSGGPLSNIVGPWITYYLFGKNPYDSFHGRGTLPQDVFTAGGSDAFEYMLQHTANQTFAGLWKRIDLRPHTDGDQSRLEKFLQLPVISNLPGRWIKTSNRGLYDAVDPLNKSIEKDRAQKRNNVKEAIREHKDLDFTDEYTREYYERRTKPGPESLEEEILDRSKSKEAKAAVRAELQRLME